MFSQRAPSRGGKEAGRVGGPRHGRAVGGVEGGEGHFLREVEWGWQVAIGKTVLLGVRLDLEDAESITNWGGVLVVGVVVVCGCAEGGHPALREGWGGGIVSKVGGRPRPSVGPWTTTPAR